MREKNISATKRSFWIALVLRLVALSVSCLDRMSKRDLGGGVALPIHICIHSQQGRRSNSAIPYSYLTRDPAATFRKLESLFEMPGIFRSWVHAHFYGKRPQLGHIRFCRLCWPDGEPMIHQVQVAERDGWPAHNVFEGCVLRPQLLSWVQGGEGGGGLGRAQAFRRA